MAKDDGTIVDTHNVEPGKIQAQTIAKLYDKDLIDEVSVEKVTYYSDGLKIKGYVARPRKDGDYPVILWNRGGFRDRGKLDDMTSWLILASTARWGYIVGGSNYRANDGGEGEFDDYGGKDVNDARNMLRVLEQQDGADMDRVAIEGASRGGMNTYRILRDDNRFKCAIVHAGIADLISLCQYDRDLCRLLDKKHSDKSKDDYEQELKSLSAVHFADDLPKDCPILVMHGDNDSVVPIDQSDKLVEALKEADIPHEYVILDGGTHVALKDGTYKEMDKHRKIWLDKYL